MTLKLNRTALVFIAALFSFSVFAKPAVTDIIAQLPRDLDSGIFTISFKVKGILEKASDPSEYNKRVTLTVPDISATKAIPFNDPVEGVDFTIEADIPDTIEETDLSVTASFSFTVRSTFTGKLKEAVGDDNEMKFTLDYAEANDSSQQVEGTLTRSNSVAAEAPEITSVGGSFRKVIARWTVQTSVKDSDGKSQDFSGIKLYAISKGLGDSIELDGKVFSKEDEEDTVTSVCTVDLTVADGEACVSCDPAGAYLDNGSISTAYPEEKDFKVKTSSDNSGKISASGLEIDQPYMIFLTFNPDAIVHSACYTATPTENLTLAEFYGEDKAKQNDPRCFIATAAYGSYLHQELDSLRWFRDAILLDQLPFGAKLVDFYYENSMPVAEFTRTNPWFAAIVRGVLFVPVKLISLGRWVFELRALNDSPL